MIGYSRAFWPLACELCCVSRGSNGYKQDSPQPSAPTASEVEDMDRRRSGQSSNSSTPKKRTSGQHEGENIYVENDDLKEFAAPEGELVPPLQSRLPLLIVAFLLQRDPRQPSRSTRSYIILLPVARRSGVPSGGRPRRKHLGFQQAPRRELEGTFSRIQRTSYVTGVGDVMSTSVFVPDTSSARSVTSGITQTASRQ